MTAYLLDYVGSAIQTIGGIGQFGQYESEEVVRDGEGNVVFGPDNLPRVKTIMVKFGPHEVSASVAGEFSTAEMQAAGWIVAKVDAPSPGHSFHENAPQE